MDERAYKISVLDSGEEFFCKENDYILNAMICSRCGPIHHGCCGGGCGVCKMKIVSGGVAADRMSRAHVSQEEQEQGYVLICRVKPRGNVVLARV